MQHPLQLFDGLGAIGPVVEQRQQQAPPPQQRLQQQQTVSEAQRQVAALVGSLADSPTTGGLLPLPIPGPPALRGDAEQQRLQQQHEDDPQAQEQDSKEEQQQPAPVQVAAAPAAAGGPCATEGEVALAAMNEGQPDGGAVQKDAGTAAEAQEPAAGEQTLAVEAMAVDAPMTDQQEAGAPAAAAPAAATAAPAEEGQQSRAAEDEWADAVPALPLLGSQGDEDFQDAEEELPAVALAAPEAVGAEAAGATAAGACGGLPAVVAGGQAW